MSFNIFNTDIVMKFVSYYRIKNNYLSFLYPFLPNNEFNKKIINLLALPIC